MGKLSCSDMWSIVVKDRLKRRALKSPHTGAFTPRKMSSATGAALVQLRIRSGIWYFSSQGTADHPACHHPLMIMFNHTSACI